MSWSPSTTQRLLLATVEQRFGERGRKRFLAKMANWARRQERTNSLDALTDAELRRLLKEATHDDFHRRRAARLRLNALVARWPGDNAVQLDEIPAHLLRGPAT